MTDTPLPVEAQITFCYTTDLEASARFWGEAVGLPLAVDQGACRIYRAGGGAYIGVCRCDAARATDGIILTLVTPDVDAWFERLVAAGVEVEQAPAHNPSFGIYHCFVRDPAGYRLEIQRFDDPSWNAGA